MNKINILRRMCLILVVIALSFGSIATVSASSTTKPPHSPGPTVPPVKTDPGKMYGPLYAWVKGKDLLDIPSRWITLHSETRKEVIRKYGKVDRNKTYRVKYYNYVTIVGRGLSQKGYIRNLTILFVL